MGDRQSLTDPLPGLTKRQSEVLERLERGTPVKHVAKDIGVTPAAVYQTIERLRRAGRLPATYTPSGRPGGRHEGLPPTGMADRSRLADLRAANDDDEEALAELIAAAISAGDAPALAYCLGRADTGGMQGLQLPIIEAALRRLGVLEEPGSATMGAAEAADDDEKL